MRLSLTVFLILAVSGLLLLSSPSVDAKKSHSHKDNSQQSTDSNNGSSGGGVITKFNTAAESDTTGKSLTVEQAILACPSSNSPSAPASLKPWCDTFMMYIVDYCLNHMNDKGAKESFQVCYDTDLRDGMIKYLYDNNMTVDGKKPVEVSAELAANAINNF